MQKKTVFYILLGIYAAALICLITGVIIYTVAVNTTISSTAANYAELAASRSNNLLIGLVIMIVGFSFLVPPTIILIIMLISYAVSAKKNKNN
jgi:hypothetical protein